MLLSIHKWLGFLLDFIKICSKALIVDTPFIPFKGATQAYLLKISITHKKV